MLGQFISSSPPPPCPLIMAFLLAILMPMFVVGPDAGCIDNKYRILPREHYKIFLVFYVPDHPKMFEFQTNSTGKIKFTFDKQVFGNELIDLDLKHPNAATPIKIFVFNGIEMRLLHKFKNYGEMVKDRKCNEYRLYEVFQIVFKNLPLVENEEIAFLFGDNEDDDEDDDDEEEEEEEEEDEEEEDEKPKKSKFGFLKKIFKKKRD